MAFPRLPLFTLAQPSALLLAALTVWGATVPAQAAGDGHAHAHAHKPLHGGVVVEVKDIDYELVAQPQLLQLYLRDHGKPLDLQKASARLTLLSGGGEPQAVELRPAGNRLEASGQFKLAPGSKAVAVVSIAGKTVGTVRFVLK
jgi:hypothetical protein